MSEHESYSGKAEETGDASVTRDSDGLSQALKSTLESLNRSIGQMQAIVERLEGGGADLDENIRLLAEANQLAVDSSQQLERAVQDVAFGDPDEAGQDIGNRES